MQSTSQSQSHEGKSSCAISYGIALAIACLFNAVLVVLKEKSPATLAWMKQATGHHWATHTLFTLAIFFGLGFILSKTNQGRGPSADFKSVAGLILKSVIVGALIIFVYYAFVD
jgi:hypothetical protein